MIVKMLCGLSAATASAAALDDLPQKVHDEFHDLHGDDQRDAKKQRQGAAECVEKSLCCNLRPLLHCHHIVRSIVDAQLIQKMTKKTNQVLDCVCVTRFRLFFDTSLQSYFCCGFKKNADSNGILFYITGEIPQHVNLPKC